MATLRTRTVGRLLADTTARRRLRVDGPHVALTYDDGPDPAHTPQVLSALADHGATATFFVLLTRARRYPTVLADVRAAGHEIALHGADHRPLPSLPSAETGRLLLDARRELEDLVQHPVVRYRPPYGLLTVAAALAVRRGAMRTLLWNRDFRDWVEAADDVRVRSAVSGARPGDVLLAHDAYAGTSDGATDDDEPDLDRGRLARSVLLRLAEAGLSARAAHALETPPAAP